VFAGLQIVAFDFGCKNNILRRLASFGCKVTVVPSNYPASKVMDLNPDGIFLSNGPVRSHEQWQHALCKASSPAAGICLLVKTDIPSESLQAPSSASRTGL